MTLLKERWQKSCFLALALTFCVTKAVAQVTLTEAEVKAAFLVNFARYVSWPAESPSRSGSPLVFCLIGSDALSVEMEKAEFQSVRVAGRSIRTRAPTDKESMQSCHVIYISKSETHHVAHILKQVHGKPILTVSDIDGFIHRGGAIGMIRVEKKLKFEINRNALKTANLNASANLLKLARTLIQAEP